MLHQTKTSLRRDKILLNAQALQVPVETLPPLPQIHSKSQFQQKKRISGRKKNKISKESRRKNRA